MTLKKQYISAFFNGQTIVDNQPVLVDCDTMTTKDGTPIDDFGDCILTETPAADPFAAWVAAQKATI